MHDLLPPVTYKAWHAQGSLSDTVSMHDFDIPTVENFVQYLYTGDYPSAEEGAQDSSQPDDDIKSELLRHIHCHHIASLYKVDKMTTVSRSKLQALLEKHQGSSDLSSALPHGIRQAHVVSASQDIMNTLAASVARNIGKLKDDGNLSNISNVPEFLLSVLEHSAQTSAQLEINHAAMKGCLQLLRDKKSCMNCNCGEHFNVEVTDAFEVTCRACRQRQKSDLFGFKTSPFVKRRVI